MIGAVIFTVSLPELIGWAINTGLNLRIEDGIEIEPSWGQISLMCSMVMITAIIRGLLAYLQIYLGEALSQRVAYDLRNQLYDHLQHLSLDFTTNQKSVKLCSVRPKILKVFASL